MATDEAPSGNSPRARTAWRRIRRVVAFVLFVLVVDVLVLPQLAGTREALRLLGRIQPAWVVLGIVLEALAILCYAELTRSLLPRATRPSLGTVFRIDLSTLGVSHVVPGGSAVGAGLGYDLLVRSGVSGPNAVFALGAQSVGSAVVLNVLLWLGLLVSIPTHGFDPLYTTAAVVGSLLLAVFAAAVVSLTSGEQRTAHVLRAVTRPLPFVHEDAVSRLVSQFATRLRYLGSDWRLLARAVGWAVANWLLDLASLGVFLAAFGHVVPLNDLLVAYALANVLGAIPITPGGLGIIEGVLIPTLVGFGTPRGVALLGVASWRLFNFWVPIPVGAGAYLSLRVRDARAVPAADSLADLAERAEVGAERPRQWAARVGIGRFARAPRPRPDGSDPPSQP
ncbi:MAG: flippase-like domain-containing protein [Acidimicrobiia bacterium]|nr:flippase-like domain-containing protein [Acidimicrobiia bacterium]